MLLSASRCWPPWSPALELALTATERLEQERAELLRLWEQRRERTAYEAERARRRYDAVEPENRLVARTLEQQWEAKLAAQQQPRRPITASARSTPARCRKRSGRRSVNWPPTSRRCGWRRPPRPPTARNSLRQVVDRVVIAAAGKSEQVHVTIRWMGVARPPGTVVRPIRQACDLSTYAAICEQVRTRDPRALAAASIAEAAEHAARYRPARGSAFGVQAVHDLRRRLRLTAIRPRALARRVGPG